MFSRFTVFAHYTGMIAIIPEASHKKYLQHFLPLKRKFLVQCGTFVDAEHSLKSLVGYIEYEGTHDRGIK